MWFHRLVTARSLPLPPSSRSLWQPCDSFASCCYVVVSVTTSGTPGAGNTPRAVPVSREISSNQGRQHITNGPPHTSSPLPITFPSSLPPYTVSCASACMPTDVYLLCVFMHAYHMCSKSVSLSPYTPHTHMFFLHLSPTFYSYLLLAWITGFWLFH